jgi:hypothetical protein
VNTSRGTTTRTLPQVSRTTIDALATRAGCLGSKQATNPSKSRTQFYNLGTLIYQTDCGAFVRSSKDERAIGGAPNSS